MYRTHLAQALGLTPLITQVVRHQLRTSHRLAKFGILCFCAQVSTEERHSLFFSSFLSAPAGGLEPRLLPVLQTILLLQRHHGREYVGTPGDDVAFPTRRHGEDWRRTVLDVACFWRETSRVLRRRLVVTCLVTGSRECMRPRCFASSLCTMDAGHA